MQIDKKKTVCEWASVAPVPPRPGTKLGIAMSTLGKAPINGLRHKPTETTCGWYIWCGSELSEAPDFFSPLHVEHLAEYLPDAVEYLELPPGYRFLIDGNDHEDIWFDASLLKA
jgi:hypothetical protein